MFQMWNSFDPFIKTNKFLTEKKLNFFIVPFKSGKLLFFYLFLFLYLFAQQVCIYLAKTVKKQ